MRETPEDLIRRHGISASHGFLPVENPLQRLPDKYYQPWEEAATILPQLISTYQIRSRVDALPILDADRLSSHPEWQRAYVILGFLTHAYIWGGEEPAQVSIPFMAISLLKTKL
jgi:indoleamine 2,3-dioxygenase